MKRIRRGFYSLLAVLAVVVAALAAWIGLWMPSSLPVTNGRVTVEGLAAPAEIVRDADGIVTIRAQSEADAAFALGYAHAQDRLVQMEMMRRLVAGRLSEVAGSMTLSTDQAMRLLGLYRLAAQSEASLPADTRAKLQAYADGVNAYLAGHEGSWPPEFAALFHRPEPWRVADSIAWGRIMALKLSGNSWQELLRYRLSPQLPAEQLELLMPTGGMDAATSPLGALPPTVAPTRSLLASLDPLLAPSRGASNSFAVAGSRSATGAPILANDPHLGLETPGVWYLARIETPGSVVVGATAPGVPMVIVGHNGHVAWSLTTTHGDTQDLFLEKLDPADGGRYLTPEGSAAFETRTETIVVRAGSDVEMTIRASRHGPVLSDQERLEWSDPDHVLALSWPGLRADDRTVIAMHRLQGAKDVRDAFEALRDFHTPLQNFVLADRAGNIGFVAAGRIPLRKKLSANSSMPAPGWTGEYDWTGFVPFDELPQAVNPASGLVATANSKVAPAGYPHFITARWPDAHRQDRILERLKQAPALTLDDAADILRDNVSGAARERLPELLRLLDAAAPNGSPARDSLGNWNHGIDRDGAQPLIFGTWYKETARELLAAPLGAAFADIAWADPPVVELLSRGDTPFCAASAGRQDNCAAIVRRAWDRSLALLADAYGDDPGGWRWGDAHRAKFGNALIGRVPLLAGRLFEPVETDGDDHTINRGTPDIDYESEAPLFPHVHGATLRAIFDLGDLDRSRFMIAPGQSGNPFSPHYRDLLLRWRDHDYVTMVGAGDEILILEPVP
jgi:penicillin amidase